jgi:hypothetical protein
MADTTLVTAEGALFAALSALLTDQPTGPTDARPFACVGRYSGPVDPEQGLGEVAAQWPCALLRWNGEAATREVDTELAGVQDRAAIGFDVLVGLEDPRAIDDAIAGAAGVPGLLALSDAVIAACNGLALDLATPASETLRLRRARYTGARNEWIRRGVVYVMAVGFEVLRAAPTAPDPADASPALTVQADVDLLSGDTSDVYAPQPFGQFTNP